MLLSFTLSMPGNNSWDGRWSGDSVLLARVVNFGRGKKATARAEEILKEGYFHHNFGDGWRACVTVKEVDAAEARKIRRRSKGFSGYDWMIESIRQHLEIRV